MAILARFSASGNGESQWVRLLAGMVAAVLVLGIAYSLARTTWLWFLPQQAVEVLPPREAANGATAVTAVNHAKVLAEAALFGRPDTRKPPPKRRVVVPETRLALELKGVVAGPDGKSGGAIIADKKDERFFPVGAALPGGVVLEKVYPLEVVLLRNGRQEILKLVRETLDGEGSTGSAHSAVPASNAGASTAGVGAAGANRSSGFLSANPGGINKAVRVRPIFRGGKLKGFRISPGRNRKVFAELGFRAGDLLTKVDGIAPSDPKAVFAVLNELQDRGSVTVEVTRRGRPVMLELKAP